MLCPWGGSFLGHYDESPRALHQSWIIIVFLSQLVYFIGGTDNIIIIFIMEIKLHS